MSAKLSAEMKVARDLVIKYGVSGYAVERMYRALGLKLTEGAISQDPEVKKYRQEKKDAAKPS